jgi:hypothetical protein
LNTMVADHLPRTNIVGACRTAATSSTQASAAGSAVSCVQSSEHARPTGKIVAVCSSQHISSGGNTCEHVHACAFTEHHRQHCSFGGGSSHSVQSLETLVVVVAGALNSYFRQGRSSRSHQVDRSN